MLRIAGDIHSPEFEYPSCEQTILASVDDQKSSQTVPHSPLMQASTLPCILDDPPISLTVPCVHAGHNPLKSIHVILSSYK